MEEFKEKIDRVLLEYIKENRPQHPFLGACYDRIQEYALAGGKRLRPYALTLAFTALGGNPNKIVLPAASVEFNHIHSEILDDIMDEDSTRHDHPTAYRMMQSYFEDHYGTGSKSSLFKDQSSRYGASFGIMMGMLTYILSKKALKEAPFSQEVNFEALGIMFRTDQKVYHGQMMDINMEFGHGTEEEYMHMALLKTGVLFGLAFELGAHYAGADDHVKHLFREFGQTSALSFQIQDDLLDLTGAKGHEPGSDIRNSKKTLLMLKTLEKHPSAEQYFGKEDVKKAISLMHETGAVTYAQKTADRLRRKAKDIVQVLPIDGVHKEKLFTFADYMVERHL